MRFKARIQRDRLSCLMGLVQMFEKITPANGGVVIFFSEEKVRFSVGTGTEDLQAFSELNQAEYFVDYRIESQSDNCIMFESSCALLSAALQSVKSALETQIKMAKRQGQPCLVVETRLSDMEMNVSHDIPVKILRAADVSHYSPPEVPTPNVQLEMPMHRGIRTVAEKMKGINKYAYVDADMGGQLVLRCEIDDATIKTFFVNLTPRFESMPGGENKNRHNQTTLKVDSKKLSNVLQVYSMPIESAILCLVDELTLVVHVFLAPRGSGTATYYIPALATSLN